MAPVISEAAETLGHLLDVYKVNVDENPRLAAAFKVPLVPYLVVGKDGRTLASFADNWSIEQIRAIAQQEGFQRVAN